MASPTPFENGTNGLWTKATRLCDTSGGGDSVKQARRDIWEPTAREWV